jgi:hypothetical protein
VSEHRRIKQRSVRIGKHRTGLLYDIDSHREHANFSCAVRLFVLDYYVRLAKQKTKCPPTPSPARVRVGLCICRPRVAPGVMASFHEFKIGQRVSYWPTRDTFPTWYTVTALLPERDGEFKYRIRRQGGAATDLVVGESDLRKNRER